MRTSAAAFEYVSRAPLPCSRRALDAVAGISRKRQAQHGRAACCPPALRLSSHMCTQTVLVAAGPQLLVFPFPAKPTVTRDLCLQQRFRERQRDRLQEKEESTRVRSRTPCWETPVHLSVSLQA